MSASIAQMSTFLAISFASSTSMPREVLDSAFDLRVSEQELDGAQISSASVDELGLHPAQRVRWAFRFVSNLSKTGHSPN